VAFLRKKINLEFLDCQDLVEFSGKQKIANFLESRIFGNLPQQCKKIEEINKFQLLGKLFKLQNF
jgi:hypothetical protein